MTGQELIQNILRVTTIINDAIKSNDIDTLEAMLKERQIFIENIDGIITSEMKRLYKKKIDEILSLEEENNILLEEFVQQLDLKLASKQREKNITASKMKNIRSYITSGAKSGGNSRFNRKT